MNQTARHPVNYWDLLEGKTIKEEVQWQAAIVLAKTMEIQAP